MTALVELRGVGFTYESIPVLEDVTLAIEQVRSCRSPASATAATLSKTMAKQIVTTRLRFIESRLL